MNKTSKTPETHSSPAPDGLPPSTPNSPDFSLFSDNFSAVVKARRDDRLLNLPPDDQITLMQWLATHTFHETLILAAKPRPDGLDLQTNISALHRFFHKRNLADKIQRATELVQSLCPENARDTDAALKILAETHAVETLGGPAIDNAAFQQITRYLLRQEDQRIRHRALDLHQKRLAYHMQHTHYDIFKRTVAKLTEINETVRDQSLSPAEKFDRDFIRIFGRDAFDMVNEANRKWAEQHPDQPNTAPDCTNEDVIPPLTEAEQQAAMNEAIDVMMGWKNGPPDTDEFIAKWGLPDATNKTRPT